MYVCMCVCVCVCMYVCVCACACASGEVQLIDVREPYELEDTGILAPNAINIPCKLNVFLMAYSHVYILSDNGQVVKVLWNLPA